MKKQQEANVCTIGGQAVMEGVMMKAPAGIALAVRRADNSIAAEYTAQENKAKKGTFLGWPIVRGVVTFIDSLTTGMRTITRSAELYGEEIEEEPSKFEKWLSRVTGRPVDKIVVDIAVVLAVLLAVGLFFMLPTFLSGLLLRGYEGATIWKSLTEGFVRLAIFLAYLFAISRMKETKRLFMYHGAEHKTIACYEHGAELTPENAMKYSRLHPRCGTNYMFLVMAISILFFAAVGFNANFWLRLGTRLLLLPVVAGISYEALRFGGRSESLLARIVRAPGMALQHITTAEPDEGMLEVAITAFKIALDPAYLEQKRAEEEAAKEAEAKEADSGEEPEQAAAERAEQPEDNGTAEPEPADRPLGEAEAV
ncbi:MAG TPA: DUF1385 domain-containing protein [Feifaniaceae bacterium]|nr:DUF1385 domain-containing protein [Feifaniaceae bacterium]